MDVVGGQDRRALEGLERRLRSVYIEIYKLQENGKKLYSEAKKAWEDARKTFLEAGMPQRFDLAIACVHMAWAALLRGSSCGLGGSPTWAAGI